jgi:hypothetical protein
MAIGTVGRPGRTADKEPPGKQCGDECTST